MHVRRHLAAAIGWVAVILPLAVVLLSVALPPATNWTVRIALLGFCILAVARPADALLVTCAFLEFGIILSHLVGVSRLRVTEVLTVATIAGCCVRALSGDAPLRRALLRRTSAPVVLFALAALASIAVWLRVQQVQTEYASAYLRVLLHALTRDYFVQPDQFWDLVSAFAIVEGLALYVIAAALCEIDRTFFDRALRMIAVGGAGLGLMSVVRLAEIYLRNPRNIEFLRATHAGLRISPQIPDYIAAGSYFSLCWLIGLGLAITSPRRRLLWIAAAVPSMAALYLTGSRSVIGAALGGLIVLILALVRGKAAAARGVLVFALIGIAVMVVSFRAMVGHDVAGETARQSLIVRIELARTAARVIATRPLFGVGIDRFHFLAARLATPGLNALWQGRTNPHNDFIRVATDLGLTGLGLFLWILTGALRSIRQGVRAHRDNRLIALLSGLFAFLITMLISNPLMLREIAFTFWIALGLAVGHSATLAATRDVPAGARSEASPPAIGASRFRRPLAVALAVLIVCSIPFRARQELANVDLMGITYGLFDWGTEPDGRAARLSGPRVTLYADERAQTVEVPLLGTLPSRALQQVEVRVDGRPANRVAVGPDWQPLRVVLPAASSGVARRIDLIVSPTWVPADVIPGSGDQRELGVKVGGITYLTATQGR